MPGPAFCPAGRKRRKHLPNQAEIIKRTEEKTMDLTKGKVSTALLKFTMPIILMQILNQAYMVADSVIVARFVNETALSVWSSANNILLIGYAVLSGFAGASHIVVGRFYGERKYDEVKPTVFTLGMAGMVLGILMTLAYVVFSAMVFRLMQLPEEILAQCTGVSIIYALSFPLTGIQGAAGAVINGSGNSKTQTVICVSTQILNIVLDVILISQFHTGVAGAAWASDFSMLVSCIWNVVCAYLILRKKTQAKAYFSPASLREYLVLAVPTIVQSSVMSIGTMALQVIVNSAGIEYINGYTVATTIFNLLLLPIVATSVGFETFASQNIGAQEHARVKEGYSFLMKEGLGICAVLTVIDIFFSGAMMSIYSLDVASDGYAFAKLYLLFMIPNFFLQLFKYSIEALFKANLKMNLFAFSSILSLACRLVFAFLMQPVIGLQAMAWALLFGSAVSVAYDIYWKRKLAL